MIEEIKDGVNIESDKPTKSMMESIAGEGYETFSTTSLEHLSFSCGPS